MCCKPESVPCAGLERKEAGREEQVEPAWVGKPSWGHAVGIQVHRRVLDGMDIAGGDAEMGADCPLGMAFLCWYLENILEGGSWWCAYRPCCP